MVRLWSDSNSDLHAVRKERNSAISKYEDVQVRLDELEERHKKLVTVHRDLQDVVLDLTEERSKLRTFLSSSSTADGSSGPEYEAKEAEIGTERDAFGEYHNDWNAAITAKPHQASGLLQHERERFFRGTIQAPQITHDPGSNEFWESALQALEQDRIMSRDICAYCLDCGRDPLHKPRSCATNFRRGHSRILAPSPLRQEVLPADIVEGESGWSWAEM